MTATKATGRRQAAAAGLNSHHGKVRLPLGSLRCAPPSGSLPPGSGGSGGGGTGATSPPGGAESACARSSVAEHRRARRPTSSTATTARQRAPGQLTVAGCSASAAAAVAAEKSVSQLSAGNLFQVPCLRSSHLVAQGRAPGHRRQQGKDTSQGAWSFWASACSCSPASCSRSGPCRAHSHPAAGSADTQVDTAPTR